MQAMTDLPDVSDFDEMLAAAGIIESEPTYIVSGSGTGWFYSVEKKTMVCVPRGTPVYVLEAMSGSRKTMCQAGNEIVYIPGNEILEIGWN